jgi:L-asparaginase
MRPATSLQADGPQNLLDAVTVARDARVGGVSVVIAGRAWHGAEVRKQHSHRLDAFDAGDAGPLALMEAGQVRVLRAAVGGDALGLSLISGDAAAWPRVAIVLNHAGADGSVVDALLAQGIEGLVAAGTGNGTLGLALEAALRRALAAGVVVLRSSRCAAGTVLGGDAEALPGAGSLSAVQARVELLLRLLARGIRRSAQRPPQPAAAHE